MGTDQALKEYPEIFRQVLRHGRPARGQQVRGAQQRGLVGRLVRLRPQGRRGPAAAPGLLPDQRREHRPVRADADRRRRGRQGPLHRGLHRPDLRDRLAPRRGRRGRRAARLEGPLHDHPELVERRLQPRDQARPRARERHGRVDRREHRLAPDDEVPEHLPARRGRERRHHLGRGRRQGPAPGHRREGRSTSRPNTTSRIVSKSVSKDGGRATYRGQLKVAPGRDRRRRPASAATR